MRSEVYLMPSWRDPPLHETPVAVRQVLAYFAKDLGHVPATLDAERAVSSFAGSCDLPLCDADIERGIFCDGDLKNHPRFVSRPWVREQYAKFYQWMVDEGWVEPPAPSPDSDARMNAIGNVSDGQPKKNRGRKVAAV